MRFYTFGMQVGRKDWCNFFFFLLLMGAQNGIKASCVVNEKMGSDRVSRYEGVILLPSLCMCYGRQWLSWLPCVLCIVITATLLVIRDILSSDDIFVPLQTVTYKVVKTHHVASVTIMNDLTINKSTVQQISS